VPSAGHRTSVLYYAIVVPLSQGEQAPVSVGTPPPPPPLAMIARAGWVAFKRFMRPADLVLKLALFDALLGLARSSTITSISSADAMFPCCFGGGKSTAF